MVFLVWYGMVWYSILGMAVNIEINLDRNLNLNVNLNLNLNFNLNLNLNLERYQTLRALSFFAKVEKRRTRTRITHQTLYSSRFWSKANPANLIIKRRGNL